MTVPTITDDQVAELEAAAIDAETQGLWRLVSDDMGNEIDSDEGPVIEHTSFAQDTDMAFIAKANPATIKALLAERAELKRDAERLKESISLLDEALSEIGSLTGMMEPYYSQCGADKSARELSERIELFLPKPPPPHVPPPITCDLCDGAKAKRIFKTQNALKHHKADSHFSLAMQEQPS